MFASPEQASKTINQIGDVLQKKLKGKPVGAGARPHPAAFVSAMSAVRRGAEAEPPAKQAEPDAEKEEAPPKRATRAATPTSTRTSASSRPTACAAGPRRAGRRDVFSPPGEPREYSLGVSSG